MHAQRFELNLRRQVVVSLSDALDLVGVDDVHHGKRVAVMAGECARELGWAQPEIDELPAAADVLQARAQDRPYRRSMAPRGILRVLDERVHRDKLDAGILALVRDNLA